MAALRASSALRLRVGASALSRPAVGATRRYASAAAAAQTAPSSSTSSAGSAITHPDPSTDSPTGALVASQAQYMVATYARPLPIFQRGRGSYLWDTENRQYVDFTAGIAVCGLGHSDPDIAQIVAEQAQTLLHASNLYHNPWTPALSRLLVETTQQTGGMHDASASFICNSGTEANEAALKFARKVGKVRDPSAQKIELVSFRNSFHGRTLGALSVTPTPKYQKPFGPMLPGCRVGDLNDIAALDTLVTEKTAGVIVEPIQGEGGVHEASPEFLTALAARCRAVGAVLIHDEIQCGLGRTGSFWAHEALPREAHPDVITTAKALGNGFPVGAVLVNKAVADAIQVGDHGTTFGGNPLASRVAHHIVTRLADKKLLGSVPLKGAVFRSRFDAWRRRWPERVAETRGRGLILGLQLNEDPTPIIKAARERGVLVITAGLNTLRFLPPLTIGELEINEGLERLEGALESVWGEGTK